MSTTTNDAVITSTSDREVHIERDFDAPLDRVWDAYSRIEQLSRWWGRGHVLDVGSPPSVVRDNDEHAVQRHAGDRDDLIGELQLFNVLDQVKVVGQGAAAVQRHLGGHAIDDLPDCGANSAGVPVTH